MSKGSKLGAFVAGAGLGVGLGLLFAPASGDEITSTITVASYASANSWANGTKYTSLLSYFCLNIFVVLVSSQLMNSLTFSLFNSPILISL